jgi:hypothetical protein
MAPESLIIRPSRTQSWGLISISVVFVALGLFFGLRGDSMGFWAAGFFGLCLLVGVVDAVRSWSSLRLDREGFDMRSLFRSRRYRWSDIRSFAVSSASGKTLVTFMLHAPAHSPVAGPPPGGNFDGALPDMYGQSAPALAALLDDWRLGRPREPIALEPRPRMTLQWLLQSEGGLLILKLAALFSFCGGPLFFSDLLDVKHRGPIYFAIPFAPIMLLLFGALALRDEAADRFDRWSIQGGFVGAALLLGMNVYAGFHLVTGPPRPDGTLMAIGIGIGFFTAAAYVVVGNRLVRDA